MIYGCSDPFKEPGGHCLFAGGSRDALPGPHQTARARVCSSGGSQGKVFLQAWAELTRIVAMCSDVRMDTKCIELLFLFKDALCRR